ncbi:HNH endonuclease [Pirellula staleyi DSM 6068]|uniref:HNH endonuclease n=1 Tax=Pirellula staleyi (strain ATCC 27377 / DSM 6068 / ICPB 4128) TaxID=530564 RepID=D2R238_PIRSD|nr:HNH endonuclease [Pirellula staleyi]ADB18649.1 HNH endonuclease [Pirellula staleyi DSM 6068]
MVGRILDRPTLVLNRNWQPIHVSTVQRALILVWNEAAQVVDPRDYELYDWVDWAKIPPGEGELYLQSVRSQMRVPEVIALRTFDKLPERNVSFSRRNLFKRDHYTCQYCGCQPGMHELTIDHVLPRSRGGASSWENCVLACVECNKRKADKLPDEARMKIRQKPIRPRWRPLYAATHIPIQSWTKFLSEAYWNVELEP